MTLSLHIKIDPFPNNAQDDENPSGPNTRASN